MTIESTEKHVVVFIDGQNLYHSVKTAFGYSFPNYDISKLCANLCSRESGWILKQIRFYTGVPKETDNLYWHTFWKKKLSVVGRVPNSYVCTRPLKYRILKFQDSKGEEHTGFGGVEKGIDVRIALDIIRLAHKREYDIAIVFSQDQDLSEVVPEIKNIAQEQNRVIKMFSAYPISPICDNTRGINGATWIKFDKLFYDQCIDPKDYR
ncbi:MAG: NYN domain-containing protein [Elusimicrobia bacterium]|nr:NYN domain-containing protein [Elusimicrobiota bacterium]